MNQAPFGLETALKTLRRRGWIILLCTVVATAAAFGLSSAQTKKYTAVAALLFKDTSVVQQASGLQAVTQSDPVGARLTNLELVRLSGPSAQGAASLLRGRISPQEVRDAVTASQDGQSNIILVSATWTSPSVAAQIANAFSRAFIEQQTRNDRSTTADAIGLVNQQYLGLTPAERASGRGQSLLDHIESLRILEALQASTQVAQTASVPVNPSSPHTNRNTILGFALGLILGLGVAFLMERLDRRLREPADVAQTLGLPILGIVLRGRADHRTSGANLEQFRMLRVQLRYFNVDRELGSIVITSALPSEGKTTISRGLAVAAVEMGTKTLLIEADLRRPTLAKIFGLPPTPGLAGALVDPGSVDACVRSIDLSELGGVHGSENGSPRRVLDVLAAGTVPPNPVELLESEAMEGLLSWSRARYELVVVDTAPVSAVPDAIPLMGLVDGVVVVSRLGLSTRDVLRRLHERLAGVAAPVLGVVVNDVKARESSYYGYTYDSEYATSTPVTEPATSRSR